MSGRDLRAFITSHRANDLDKLTQRMRDGLGSSKCKPVQYEQLQAMVAGKRLSSEEIEQKVLKAWRAAQVSRQNGFMRQHRHAWSRENGRLCRAREKAERELQSFLGQCELREIMDWSVCSELLQYELQLERERKDFQLATVGPILELRGDLLFRLRTESLPANHSAEWERVLQQVLLVKEQQRVIVGRMSSERLCLEQELASTGLEDSLCPSEADSVSMLKNVPEEIVNAECPYPELRASLLIEFHSLSEKYRKRLETIHSRVQGLDRHCGWPAEDHLRFQATVNQYSPSLPNHQRLYLDMLQKLFPHTPRQELCAHERRWVCQRFSEAQLRLALQSWQRDRAQLTMRALAVLDEARQDHRDQQALQRDRSNQQHICSQLHEKLQQWREQQEEAAHLEAAISARWHEEQEEKLKKKQEREQAKRSQHKQEVERFYAELQRRREEVERRDQQRLAELRTHMAAQAHRDRERVLFREEMSQQRKQEREAREQLRQRAEEQREERLQTLRNQVAVVVAADPERMMGDTKAWMSHVHPEEEFMLHKPLYHLHTYTDTQIVSDPRVRLEQALRNAGLHATAYAKEVLSTVPPPRPPRRDAQSTAFGPL